MAEATKLRLYNTLTRSKEEFSPIDPANVRMYVCGPTVYDYAHIGNARPAIVFDVLFRLLRHLAKQGVWDGGKGETQVTYVRNITDVDDKINARALRDFGGEIAAGRLTLNEAIRRVTETTADQYQKDVTALGCLPPTYQPRATEFVLPEPGKKSDMVTLIQQLLDKGHAYAATGREGREILFDTALMPDYGQLSKRNLDEQQAGARVEVEAHKKHPADFVLWKESSADEPGWNAHFHVGAEHLDIRGRPGWHIECSAMSAAYLGDEFDIHGGGLDLIFPHHENEIAQSRCAHGTHAMARTWMHNGFLQVEGQKMSKSLGNFVTIHDLLQGIGRRPFAGEVVRLAMLETHYRQPIDFTEAKLESCRRKLASWIERFSNFASEKLQNDLLIGKVKIIPTVETVNALLDDLNYASVIANLDRLANLAPNSPEAGGKLGIDLIWLGLFRSYLSDMYYDSAMTAVPPALYRKHRDVLPNAQALVANNYIWSNDYDVRMRSRMEVESLFSRFSEALSADGLALELREHGGVVLVYKKAVTDPEVETAVNRRLAFIREKNWAEADRIRDELLAQGIQLKDGKDPSTGERITTWEVKR